MPGITKYHRSEYVECKYYRKESTIEIKCKGLCGCHSVQVFQSGKEKKDYMDDFCKGLYWNCPMYIALDIDNGESL